MARVVVERLRRTWFGSALALIGLAILTIVPVEHQCIGIAAVRGGRGGIFCSWSPALESPHQPGIILMLLFVAAIVVLPLAFPYPRVLVVTGIVSAAAVVGLLIFTSVSYDFYLALARLGVDLTNEARSALLALLPSSITWLVAGFRRRSRTAV